MPTPGQLKIYVASSWRNRSYPRVVTQLREMGHEVYDFRNPTGKGTGFSWGPIDPNWRKCQPQKVRENLLNSDAGAGFKTDMDALSNCDLCILVMPCGRSAHLELGYAVGARKQTIIYFPTFFRVECELMWGMAKRIATNTEELKECVEQVGVAIGIKQSADARLGGMYGLVSPSGTRWA